MSTQTTSLLWLVGTLRHKTISQKNKGTWPQIYITSVDRKTITLP
jgi:hypothetical protein